MIQDTNNPQKIIAKTILSRIKQDDYFGILYNMNLYRGCQHGCIYCDSRSTCYQLGELSHVRVKENAITLLRKELKTKRKKGTIGTGSMNDPYMPIEKTEVLTRQALQVISDFHYPIHVITKGTLVLRDADIIKQISTTYAAVSFTITTSDNSLARILEPVAPATSDRFLALKTLRMKGIYAGITLMPLLPYINDNVENLREIITKASDCGAQYIIPSFGVTLREGSRDYFYTRLKQHFPGLKEKYVLQYGNSYMCNSEKVKKLYDVFYNLTQKMGIPTRMQFYKPPEDTQLKLF